MRQTLISRKLEILEDRVMHSLFSSSSSEKMKVKTIQKMGHARAKYRQMLFAVLARYYDRRAGKLYYEISEINEYSDAFLFLIQRKKTYQEYAVRCFELADRYALLSLTDKMH